MRLRLDGVDRRSGAAARETNVALLLRDGFSQRFLLNRHVAPPGDQIPVRVLDLGNRSRRIDERLRRTRIGVDQGQFQLSLRGVHAGVLEQRLVDGQV